jgi:hypothetical protein
MAEARLVEAFSVLIYFVLVAGRFENDTLEEIQCVLVRSYSGIKFWLVD